MEPRAIEMERKYRFVEELPEDFACPVCLGAVYDAVETKCCGHYLCMACSDRLIASDMACPQCRASPLVAQDGLFMRRKLRQLHIHCVNEGSVGYFFKRFYPNCPNGPYHLPPPPIEVPQCSWSGEISNLLSHLDNHCPCAAVKCQYNCDTKLLRYQREHHEGTVCRKRPFSCWFCEMKATAEVIQQHAGKCDRRPIKCPNACPATEQLVQGDLKSHLEQCPLQKIACEFEHVGCTEKSLRKDYASHIECNTQKHLQLLSQSFAALAKEVVSIKKEAEKEKKKVNRVSQLQLEGITITVPPIYFSH